MTESRTLNLDPTSKQRLYDIGIDLIEIILESDTIDLSRKYNLLKICLDSIVNNDDMEYGFYLSETLLLDLEEKEIVNKNELSACFPNIYHIMTSEDFKENNAMSKLTGLAMESNCFRDLFVEKLESSIVSFLNKSNTHITSDNCYNIFSNLVHVFNYVGPEDKKDEYRKRKMEYLDRIYARLYERIEEQNKNVKIDIEKGLGCYVGFLGYFNLPTPSIEELKKKFSAIAKERKEEAKNKKKEKEKLKKKYDRESLKLSATSLNPSETDESVNFEFEEEEDKKINHFIGKKEENKAIVMAEVYGQELPPSAFHKKNENPLARRTNEKRDKTVEELLNRAENTYIDTTKRSGSKERSYVRAKSLTNKYYNKLFKSGQLIEEKTKSGFIYRSQDKVLGSSHKLHGKSAEKFPHRKAIFLDLLEKKPQQNTSKKEEEKSKPNIPNFKKSKK